MCFTGDNLKKKKYTDLEMMQINWERFVFRSFLILGGILFLGFVAYLLWCLQ